MLWKALTQGEEVTATSEQLRSFSELYISDRELTSRMSELFWFDCFVIDRCYGVSVREILDSVENLEAGEPHSGIKPATQFKNLPLKGLWHKHFFSAQFLMLNIANALGKNGVQKLVTEIFDEKQSPTITQEMIDELAHRVTHEPVEARDNDGKITGEWIIFAKNGGKNYYLSVNTHAAGDQFIYDRIAEHCIRDFPDLLSWLP